MCGEDCHVNLSQSILEGKPGHTTIYDWRLGICTNNRMNVCKYWEKTLEQQSPCLEYDKYCKLYNE